MKYSCLKIGIVGAVAALGMVSFVYLYGVHTIPHRTQQVELAENGFVPDRVTIAKGDMIVFTTARGAPFWPASDLHPTHEIYPEFDPKKPIPATESWLFQFDRKGEWKYHDHLNPLFRGTIVVRDDSQSADISQRVGATTIEACGMMSESGRRFACWRDIIDAALSSQGVAAAFDIVARLSSEYPEFANQCHGFTHLIGQSAYDVFRQGGKIEITQKASYCGYGFYHGFLEALLQKGGTMEQARTLCEHADQEYSGRVADSAGPLRACYHGVGHGVTDGSNVAARESAQAIIRPGLSLCERFGTTDFKKELCASGVFNSLAIMYPNPAYRLPLEKNDPYRICRMQEKPYIKKACYEEMNTLVMGLTGNDFEKAAEIADSISERTYAQYAIQSIASYAASFALRESARKNTAGSCRARAVDTREKCLDGFVGGLFEFGSPGQEYHEALDFCSSGIAESEKLLCYRSAVGYASYMYPQEKMDKMCAAIEPAYRYVCKKSQILPGIDQARDVFKLPAR